MTDEDDKERARSASGAAPETSAVAAASAHERRGLPPWCYALCAVPLIGVLELGLHLRQTSEVVPDADWLAARDAVKAELKPDDQVVFAPFWADPLGRRFFGDELVPTKRAAAPDETRFKRVFEVSIRGAHSEALAHWRKVSERKTGAVAITVYENPSPVTVLSDVVGEFGRRVTVSRVDASGETPCVFQHGTTQGGSTAVPQGVLVPADRFTCQAGYVGVAVLHALDHHPHLCIFATPPGGTAALRIRVPNTTFGTALHGHSGIQWVGERTPSSDLVEVAFSAFDRPLGRHVHRVGVGWVGFEFPTEDFDGKTGELVADVSGSAAQRGFCFEADTRRAAR